MTNRSRQREPVPFQSPRVSGAWRWFALILTVGLSDGVLAQDLFFEDVSARLEGNHPVERSKGVGWNGAAWFDYDRDGFLDLFVARGTPHNNALFHNDGDGTFTDVALDANVACGLGSGSASAADIDNDGYQELFVTGDRRSRFDGTTPPKLYHNRRDGTFADITAASGISGSRTMSNAAWADIDRDGFLDLFIGGGEVSSGNRLFLNNQNRTFADISSLSGVDVADGNCLGFFSDYDGDGWPDLFTTRFAGSRTFSLWRNSGNYSFTEVHAEAGLDDVGAWMSWGPGDIDNDGDIDLFVTNYGGANEFLGRRFPHALWRNNGDGTYTNVTEQAETADFEFGWGCTLQDYDNDGLVDLFFAGSDPLNDHIGPGWGNPGTLLINNGDVTFSDRTASMPIDLSSHYASGVAAADYDNDGRVDVVVATEALNGFSARPVLLRNRAAAGNWLGIRLQGTVSNRDAVGARVEITAGQLRQTREVYAGTGFLSMDSQWLHFGLGDATTIDRLRITWPSGKIHVQEDLDPNQLLTVVEPEDGADGPRAGIRWERSLPDTIVGGAEVLLSGILDLGKAEAEDAPSVRADLSDVGGPADLALTPLGNGRYLLESVARPESGLAFVSLAVDRGAGPLRILVPLAILPPADQVIFDDDFSSSWRYDFGSLEPEPSSDQVFVGTAGLEVRSSLGFFDFVLRPGPPLRAFGYRLRFAVHPGNVRHTPGTSFKVSFGEQATLWESELLNSDPAVVDLSRKEWQQVEIPLGRFGSDYSIESLTFSGFMRGTYYLDDVRLVAAPPPASTAVIEERGDVAPRDFALRQNAPNPFNSETVIGFDLRRNSELTELRVFNVEGQAVAVLLSGARRPGTHTVVWDGRDGAGRKLASGVYFYRLRSEHASQTRKLLLLR